MIGWVVMVSMRATGWLCSLRLPHRGAEGQGSRGLSVGQAADWHDSLATAPTDFLDPEGSRCGV